MQRDEHAKCKRDAFAHEDEETEDVYTERLKILLNLDMLIWEYLYEDTVFKNQMFKKLQ